MSTIISDAFELAYALHPQPRKSGKFWRVPCIAHGGDGFNLAIGDGSTGGFILKCHSRECAYKDITVAIVQRDIRLKSKWVYAPGNWSQRVDVPGDKRLSAPGSPKGLPLLLRDDSPDSTIVVVEGESDANALESLALDGYTPASFKGGASNAHHPDVSTVAGRNVVVWADPDAAGDKMRSVLPDRLVAAGASSVHIVRYGVDKQGPADFTRAEILIALERAEEYFVEPPVTGYEDCGFEIIGGLPSPYWAESAVGDAYRLLSLFGERILLATRSEDFSKPHVLDRRSGVWHPAPELLYELHVLTARRFAQRAVALMLNKEMAESVAKKLLTWLTRTQSPVSVKAMADSLGAAYLSQVEDKIEVKQLGDRCRIDELDKDRMYIGTPNGIVNLDTGLLLPPEEGKRCRVTRSVPDDYDANAKHPAADALIAHLGAEERRYLEQALGYHFRHGPQRRVYLLLGPPAAGKSTLLGAIGAALGQVKSGGYSMAIDSSALIATRFATRNAHSGGLFGIQDALFASMSELPSKGNLSVPDLKRLDGVEPLSIRDVSEKAGVSRPSKAALMFSCNRADIDRLDLSDDGLAARVRILPYPAVPNPASDLAQVVTQDSKVRQAVFAWLVRLARTHRDVPADIPSVTEATQQQIDASLGQVGLWVREHLRYTGDARDFATASGIWSSARKAFPDSAPNTVEGMEKRSFQALLKRVVDGLPKQTRQSLNGSQNRGYARMRLYTDDELLRLCVDCSQPLEHEGSGRCPGCADPILGKLPPTAQMESQGAIGAVIGSSTATLRYLCQSCGAMFDAHGDFVAHVRGHEPNSIEQARRLEDGGNPHD